MSAVETSRPEVGAELRSAARGGVVTVAGAATSTAMGFVLTMVLARQFGATGAGVVQQVIAVATLALALGRVGTDTTAVWLLPRLRTQDPGALRAACTTLLVVAALGGSVVALAWPVVDAATGGTVLGDARVDDAFSAVAWALPFGAVMMTALAATRGFGGVLPFNLIGNIAVPGLRPVIVVVIGALGGSAVAAATGWAVVLVPGAVLAVLVLARRLRGAERVLGVPGTGRPSRALVRQILGFGVPRTVSTLLEQALGWLDVVLVGILLGPAAAGVYGVASRFVAGGLVLMTALRIVVAPQFSARLAAGENAEAGRLYAITSTWIVFFGVPIYVLLACFAPFVLSIPGPEFAGGRTAMIVLCVGGVALLAAGNLQSLLLMTGRSGRALVNKVVVVATGVGCNLLLIPAWGIAGAAATWALCWILDGLLSAVQVSRLTGIRPSVGRIAAGIGAGTAVTAPAALVGIAVGGQSLLGFAVALVLTGVGVLAAARVGRSFLHLDQFSGIVRRRGAAGGP
ncbi:oligosaccharide flippase family protein [Nocardioides nitrophenolicus]|uniref:oligosaccharide flippase family protein n=1 Tax=Nocardioides nitrophenolicus TaxID=60489 RepID=UPI00195D77DF|nr:oligosaccharide flippase family protein [Nocardioides nitrophenolicus]MBM7520294.1 O-antigen/teichoic acid export membrane protein [Nocardioides nitrophenolicus]